MKLSKTLILSTTALAFLVACTPDPNAPPRQNTTTGAVTGAVIGGILAGSQGKGNKLAQGLLGAAVGGAIGGAIGNSLDAQAAELRSQISDPNVGITNTGSALVVNMPESILFAFDSAVVQPNLTNSLYAVAANLQKYPNSLVQVIGHTDNSGAAAYNQDLSQRRAASVANVLISAGVSANRVISIGRGEDMPVASNLSAAGRAQNRRVEIIIRPNA